MSSALISVGPTVSVAAEAASPVEEAPGSQTSVLDVFEATYRRTFEVTSCTGEKEVCTRQALALPTATSRKRSVCLASVYPTIRYSRDHRSALGVEYQVVASVNAPTTNERLRRSFPGITIVGGEGLQDVCVPRTIDVGGQIVTVWLRELDGRELGVTIPNDDEDALGLGLGLGIDQLGIRFALAERGPSFTQSLVEAIFGSSATGMVQVSIISPRPKEDVFLDRTLLGQTNIDGIKIAASALRRVKVRTSGRLKSLLECRADGELRGRTRLDFRC